MQESDACYVLDAHFSFGHFHVFTPGWSGIHEADMERVTAELTRILDSFRILHRLPSPDGILTRKGESYFSYGIHLRV